MAKASNKHLTYDDAMSLSGKRDKTTKEIAAAYKVHVSTVSKWMQKGCPHNAPTARKQSAMFNADEVTEWMKTANITGRMGRPHTPASEEKLALEIRLKAAQVEKAERENAISKGMYILAADEQARDVQKIVAMRNKLSALGATLAPQLVGQDGPFIQDAIDKATAAILEQFSKGE